MRSPRASGLKVSGLGLEVARRYRPRFPQRAASKQRPLPLRQYERRPFRCSEIAEDAAPRTHPPADQVDVVIGDEAGRSVALNHS
jgi:hypothetical protein